jgi:hypothetical protein
LVAVSAAVAKDHPGKEHPGKGHKPPAAGAACKPSVAVVLTGVLAADVDPADGDTSFVMTIKRSNKHGKAFKAAGSATVVVDAKTKVRRQGAHNLGALAPNDRLSVKAKVCKANLTGSTMPQLTARKIDAHPVKAPSGP